MKLFILTLLYLLENVSSESTTFMPPSTWCGYLAPEDAKKYSACRSLKTLADPVETAAVKGATSAYATTPAPTIVDPIVKQLYPNHELLPPNKVMFSRENFEGDIQGIDQEMDTNNLDEMAKNFVKDESKRWPGGVVPYELSRYFRTVIDLAGPLDKKMIVNSLNVLQSKTCLKFRVKNKNDVDYLSIVPGFGCSSDVGKQGGQQVLLLQLSGCMQPGIIQHEVMHALGFYHEQARTDRDEYVEINWDNIAERDKKAFLKYTDVEITAFGEPYDFGSIMHYGMYDFAVDPDVYTIKPKDSDAEMGQRKQLSEIDIRKINMGYCPTPCPSEDGWKSFGRKCYYFSFLDDEDAKTFANARRFCKDKKARIATAKQKEQIQFLESTIASADLETSDVWLNECETLHAGSTSATVSDCENVLPFICERRI